MSPDVTNIVLDKDFNNKSMNDPHQLDLTISPNKKTMTTISPSAYKKTTPKNKAQH